MQMLVSRRSVLKGATVSSVALSLEPLRNLAHAQNVGPTAQGSNIAISKDLFSFVNDSLGGIMSKATRGTATKQDLRDAASHLRLLSTHLSNTGFDEAFSQSLPQAAPIDFSKTTPLPSVLHSVKQYEPTITTEKFWPVGQAASSAQVQDVYNNVKNAGLSGMLGHLADQLHRGAASSKFRVGSSTEDISKLIVSDGVYRPDSSSAHATQVQSCTAPDSTLLENICKVVDISLASLTAAVSIFAAQCEKDPALYGFCAALTYELAVIGWSLGATLGVTLAIATILVLILC